MIVSRKAIQHIFEEYYRVNDEPCVCELTYYKEEGAAIPLEIVHMHWRRLNLESNPEEEERKYGMELNLTYEIDALLELFETLDFIGKLKLT